MLELVFLSLIVIVSVIMYQLPIFNKKFIFDESINLVQFFYLVVAPTIGMGLYALIVIEILFRPPVWVIPLNDKFFLFTSIFICGLVSLAMGMHSVAKITSYFLEDVKNRKVLIINKFFHGPMSHAMFFFNALLLCVNVALFELNHPRPDSRLLGLIIFGIVGGVGYAIAVHYYRRISKYFIFNSILLLFMIWIYESYDVVLGDQPYFAAALMILISSFATFLILKPFGKHVIRIYR